MIYTHGFVIYIKNESIDMPYYGFPSLPLPTFGWTEYTTESFNQVKCIWHRPFYNIPCYDITRSAFRLKGLKISDNKFNALETVTQDFLSTLRD